MHEVKDIFLGGTCNESTWRDDFISYLKKYNCPYTWFNPVVEDWTEECKLEEDYQKEHCKISVFCITPKMTGVFSIAEMVEAAITKPDSTYIIIRRIDGEDTWTPGQMKSLKAVRDLCRKYGAHCHASLVGAAQAICGVTPVDER